MRIFVAGATGVIGRRLVPMLVAGGHHVIATTRTPGKLEPLRAQGAEALVVDGLDREAVMRAVTSARPDAVVHQMTAIGPIGNPKQIDKEFALTNRLRTTGTDYLLAAAQAAGARQFVAQSYSGWPNERRGGRIKTEDDPLDSQPPSSMSRTFAAIRQLESTVAHATVLAGTVLRYGVFYGPGTSIAEGQDMIESIRHRRFPLVGRGEGVWSFVHIDDAARATQLAVERGAGGIYNIVDEEPAAVSEWLPELARLVGARPPFHVPVWIGRLATGEAGISLMTQVRGSSNAKAKRALGWAPAYASWRDGFRRGL